MIESTILLQDIDPLVLYGVNNNKLDVLKKAFPLLRMVFRGDKIKVSGKGDEIEQFELKMRVIVEHIKQYQDITFKDIEKIAMSETPNAAYLAKAIMDMQCELVHLINE
jgi:phosphate starvation-inducible PhoH-like protein